MNKIIIILLAVMIISITLLSYRIYTLNTYSNVVQAIMVDMTPADNLWHHVSIVTNYGTISSWIQKERSQLPEVSYYLDGKITREQCVKLPE